MGNGKKRKNVKSRTDPGASSSWASSLMRSAIVTISAVAAMYATGTLPIHPQIPNPASSISSPSATPGSVPRREITFEEAKQSPSLREAYVEQYATRIALPPYVKSVRYDPRQQRPREELVKDNCFFETRVGDDLRQRGSRLESTIKVFDNAFTWWSEAEFKAGLEYHELTHARAFWEGFEFIPDSAFYVKFQGRRTFHKSFRDVVSELHAVQEQFKRSMADENIYSRRYLHELMKFWTGQYRKLWSTDLLYADTTSLKIRFFHDMMGNYPWRLERELPNSSRYCISIAPGVKAKDFVPKSGNHSNLLIDLPAGLNQRIDAFYEEYVRRGFHYQTPEFDQFVRKTTPDANRGGP